MQSAVLRALEFDRIVEMVRGFALTPMGDERLARARAVGRRRRKWRSGWPRRPKPRNTSQRTRSFRCAHRASCRRCSRRSPSKAGRSNRCGCSRWRRFSIRWTRAKPRSAARRDRSFTSRPRAAAAPRRSRPRPPRSRDKIDPSGEVVDDASPELRHIRERLRKQRSRLRGTLESYLRGKDTAKYLQDHVVTERNGRYVLVVKAEHRTSIPGIVHGASTSGASLFLEPLSTVEINNDIVALDEQEIEAGAPDPARADRRVPRAGGGSARGRSMPRPSSTSCRRARGFRSRSTASSRRLSTDGAFELQAARHPLVKAAVPVTIKIIPPATLPADHRTEYRRQDGRAQDGGAARADGAGRACGFRRLTDRGCRCSDRSSPTSATSSRSTPA